MFNAESSFFVLDSFSFFDAGAPTGARTTGCRVAITTTTPHAPDPDLPAGGVSDTGLAGALGVEGWDNLLLSPERHTVPIGLLGDV